MLTRHFYAQGHTVTVLSRKPQVTPWRMMRWDASTLGRWVDELEQSDVCINLTGRSVNCRCTEENRKEIYESRIRSTLLLHEAIASLRNPPRVWLNASTATIYRNALDRPMDEASGELGGDERGAPATWNFSIDVAKSWEAAFFSVSHPRTRQVGLRSAITLSADRGGVFDVLLGLVRRGLGGTMGSGAQMVSWIHEKDFLNAVDFLIANEDISGVVNLAAPNPLPNRDFMKALRKAWGARTVLSAPSWLIEFGTFFMRTESELVLKSRWVLPERLLAAGFAFQFPEWASAARDLVTRWRKRRASQ